MGIELQLGLLTSENRNTNGDRNDNGKNLKESVIQRKYRKDGTAPEAAINFQVLVKIS